MLAARVAGKSESEIRELVSRLTPAATARPDSYPSCARRAESKSMTRSRANEKRVGDVNP